MTWICSSQSSELTEPCGAALAPTGSSSGKDRNRLDVYSLIQNKQTSKFRVDLGQIVPLKSTFVVDHDRAAAYIG